MQELLQVLVVHVFGGTGGRDHELAPEFALPHADAVVEDVVVRVGEGLARLLPDLRLREIGGDALREEPVLYLRDVAFHLDIAGLDRDKRIRAKQPAACHQAPTANHQLLHLHFDHPF